MTPSTIPAWLLVGCGGFAGSVARHAIASWWIAQQPQARFPWPTFAVNLSGCLLVGVLAGLVDRDALGGQARLLFVVGVLGGYTTFSAFGLESLLLLRRGEQGLALAYVAGTVLLGLAAVWLGLRIAGMPPARG